MSAFDFAFRNCRMRAWEEGRGPAIVFLHGFLEDRSMWEFLREAFPAFRKIALDLPGHGQSDSLGYLHRMEDMAEVVEALRQKLALRKFHLVGHSMGGYVALAYAEKYPDRLRSIVLLNSSTRADSPERQASREQAIALVKSKSDSYVRKAIPLLFRPKNRKRLASAVAACKAVALATSPRAIVAALAGMKERADREVLLHFGVAPVLFIAARHDPIIPLSSIEAQVAESPLAEAIYIDEGHMSHLENPAAVLAALRYWFRKHPR